MKVNSTDALIKWYLGGYSKPWKVWKHKGGSVETQLIPLNDFIIKLTLDEKRKLPKKTCLQLREAYRVKENITSKVN